LNHLPPDITSGQGLNGFQKLFSFYNTFYNTRDMVNDIFDKTTKMATIFFQKIRDVLAIQNTNAHGRNTEKLPKKRFTKA
jgi:hypothetical protein